MKDTCDTLYMYTRVIPSYLSVPLNIKNSGVRNEELLRAAKKQNDDMNYIGFNIEIISIH